MAETVETYGSIDIVVNNVGGSRWTPLEDISDTEWHEILDLNLVSAARVNRLAIPENEKTGQRCHPDDNLYLRSGRRWTYYL